MSRLPQMALLVVAMFLVRSAFGQMLDLGDVKPATEAKPAEAKPASILDQLSANGQPVAKSEEGIVLGRGIERVDSQAVYAVPVTMTVRAKTNSNNIRLYFGDKGIVIFNWEVRPTELRYHDPATGEQKGVPEQGGVPKGQIVTIQWTIEADRSRITVDGQERASFPGKFVGVSGRPGVGTAHGGDATVNSFDVTGVAAAAAPAGEAPNLANVAIYTFGAYLSAKKPLDEAVLATLRREFPDVPINSAPAGVLPRLEFKEITIPAGQAPKPKFLEMTGRGLSADDVKALSNASVMWLGTYGGPRGPGAVAAVKQIDAIALRLAELGGGYVYDNSSDRFHSQKWWKEKRLSAWHGNFPDADVFVALEAAAMPDRKQTTVNTRGLSKFGLPELVLDNVQNDMGLPLIMTAAQTLLEGRQPVRDATGRLRLSIDTNAVQHPAYAAQLAGVAPKKGSYDIPLREGQPSFERFYTDDRPLIFDFSGSPGNTELERQNAVYHAVFGTTTYKKK